MRADLARLRAAYTAYQQWWLRQTRRVQALVVVIAPLLVVALWLYAWHGPSVRQRAVLQTSLAAARTEHAEQERTAQQSAQDRQAAEARVAELRQAMDQAQAALQALRGQAVPPAAMRERLAELVARSGPAQWVSLESAPALILPRASLFRHPLVLQLDGDFEALLASVRAIEEQAASVHWSAVQFEVLDYPTLRARLELYTVSDQKTWLRL